MLKKSQQELQSKPASAEYFTGAARIMSLVKNDNIGCNVAWVTFEPKARNHWHTHPAGQVLIVTEGKGYVQKRGEKRQLLLPGDVVIILAGEEHWHGATADSIFTHIAIQPVSENGEEISWLEEVSDKEYVGEW